LKTKPPKKIKTMLEALLHPPTAPAPDQIPPPQIGYPNGSIIIPGVGYIPPWNRDGTIIPFGQ